MNFRTVVSGFKKVSTLFGLVSVFFRLGRWDLEIENIFHISQENHSRNSKRANRHVCTFSQSLTWTYMTVWFHPFFHFQRTPEIPEQSRFSANGQHMLWTIPKKREKSQFRSQTWTPRMDLDSQITTITSGKIWGKILSVRSLLGHCLMGGWVPLAVEVELDLTWVF